MPMSLDGDRPQVLVCGSGCAGSLLAWILARQGLSVVLIDSQRHPRFAIGESSTPLADFYLEQMAERYGLPQLAPLARWGSWQRAYPQLGCGKKRGFSYYGHAEHASFCDNDQHGHSLLVAASDCDEVSDTHWLRADVDQWLCQQATAAGVTLIENTRINSIARDGLRWRVQGTGHDSGDTSIPLHVSSNHPNKTFECFPDWIVDATGSGGVVPRALGVERIDHELRTRTGSLFGHFANVGSMTKWVKSMGIPISDDPFDGDDAAQHHVLDDGWVWMLRFSHGVTSVGFTRPTHVWQQEGLAERDPGSAWDNILERYPTLADLLGQAKLVGPTFRDGSSASLAWMPRISRLWREAAGDGWLALPSTVGVIDPLHSTGLAHALSGVQRSADLLLTTDRRTQLELLDKYRREVVDEVRWIDRLVSSCYAGLPDFQLFTAACSFYFIAAIDCEHELRTLGKLSHGFLGCQRLQWRHLVDDFTFRLGQVDWRRSAAARQRLITDLRQSIAPWNKVGLLDPVHNNRFSRSATKA
ncbi:MAG: FAD-dependent oxidoreductase [Pirellulaceae bacterium]|nr:FAD-dependent oxidoreductase [Pirellulaceae bacterium]